MEPKRISFGILPDGQTVELCTLISSHAQVTISTLGATLVSVRTPDRNGNWADIALGFDDANAYLERPGCLGATIGRYAGRIGRSRFPLNGQIIELAQNHPAHTIHGGPEGFHRRLWTVQNHTESRLELSLHSPDGDQGFPGALTVTVCFSLLDDTLTMDIRAHSDADTVCSITNHVYWNLSGYNGGTIDGHILSVPAERYLETDNNTIPSGRILSVDGASRDLRLPVQLKGRELDHTLLLPEGKKLQPAGRLTDPVSGRCLTVSTDLPAVQVYTSDYLPAGLPGKAGAVYGPRSGICLEAQSCPDSPNHPHFPSTILRAGETMVHTICWTFGTADEMEGSL